MADKSRFGVQFDKCTVWRICFKLGGMSGAPGEDGRLVSGSYLGLRPQALMMLCPWLGLAWLGLLRGYNSSCLRIYASKPDV
jgi:hypothetical protein